MRWWKVDIIPYSYNYSLNLKNIIEEKDKIIVNLIEDLKTRENTINFLNKDLINIKKEREDKEKCFQDIIKDLQFISSGNTNFSEIIENVKYSLNKININFHR